MRIKVENLASIGSAEVEVKPLTVFFDSNNSNGSYLSYVIYGVYRYMAEVLLEFVGKQEHQDLVSILQERIRKMFRSKSFSSLKLDIEFSEKESKVINKMIDIMSIIRRQQKAEKLIPIQSYQLGKAFYLPASRAGFVMALPSFVLGVLKERYSGGHNLEDLPEPVVDFIVDLYRIKSQSDELKGLSKKSKLLKKLSDIIGGEIWIDKNTKQLIYNPKGAKGENRIKMQVAPSYVASLAPLYVFLANIENLENHIFIVEEPEAHLHVDNQVKITELIVSMVNSGAKVLITTHSDYIINALRKLEQDFQLVELNVSNLQSVRP